VANARGSVSPPPVSKQETRLSGVSALWPTRAARSPPRRYLRRGQVCGAGAQALQVGGGYKEDGLPQ